MIDFDETLLPKETLLWEGKPAPRCYTFRNWRHSIYGSLLLIFSATWLYWGGRLMGRYDAWWPVLVPVPFVVLGAYLSVGHLLLSRLRWEKIHYALTDLRLLHLDRRGLKALSIDEVRFLRMVPLGEQLGTVRFWSGEPKPRFSFSCIERPNQMISLLEPRMTHGDTPPPGP